jgi:hypothetical protein
MATLRRSARDLVQRLDGIDMAAKVDATTAREGCCHVRGGGSSHHRYIQLCSRSRNDLSARAESLSQWAKELVSQQAVAAFVQ